eukprot:TRINITY_DN13143_c0_g1_i2.p1 TRINITY_DN13143_c0_g1~~TRINITY_DN13143_c0_g1_i2.p1  ORF type:complete len:342 (-),score=63.60 TRINITY_DN13143_c0_g1_i2:364-1272(-)
MMDHIKLAPGKLKPYKNKFDDASYRRQAMSLREAKGDATKKVLVIIDVQDGYDAAFLDSLGADVPGSSKYIQKMRDVQCAYELESRKEIRPFPFGKKKINYDKGWNRGLSGSNMQAVASRAVAEISSKKYDLVVITKDYLEPAEDGGGVFPLDRKPWSDHTKPIALVPHSEYLTFTTAGPGADVHRDIRAAFPGLTTNGKSPSAEVDGVPLIILRKQVDDAFDDDTERSARTLGEAWLDDVDVDIDGKPRRDAETLLQKLKKAGCGPGDAVLCFMGIVTNRCVAKSLIHRLLVLRSVKKGSR